MREWGPFKQPIRAGGVLRCVNDRLPVGGVQGQATAGLTGVSRTRAGRAPGGARVAPENFTKKGQGPGLGPDLSGADDTL